MIKQQLDHQSTTYQASSYLPVCMCGCAYQIQASVKGKLLIFRDLGKKYCTVRKSLREIFKTDKDRSYKNKLFTGDVRTRIT